MGNYLYGLSYNFPIQSSAADISNKRLLADIMNDKVDALMYAYNWVHDDYLFRSLTNSGAKKEPPMHYPYHVCSSDGSALAHAVTEADAVKEAERRAAASPGNTYYVTKAIAKSVTQQPVVTTRL